MANYFEHHFLTAAAARPLFAHFPYTTGETRIGADRIDCGGGHLKLPHMNFHRMAATVAENRDLARDVRVGGDDLGEKNCGAVVFWCIIAFASILSCQPAH